MVDAKSIVFSDMNACLPKGSLSRDSSEKGCWTLVDYETAEGIKGTTMYATPENQPPSVSLPMNVKGWHKLYIGIHYTRNSGGLSQGVWEGGGSVKIKLTKDRAFSTFELEQYRRHALGVFPEKTGWESSLWASVQEVFWRQADLTEQEVTFTQTDPMILSNIAYVRLVPLSEGELAEVKGEEPTDETRRLFLHIHGVDWTGGLHGEPRLFPTEEYIAEIMEPLRDSDFGAITFEGVRGDSCSYPSRIGNPFGLAEEKWHEDWIDPLEAGRRYTAEMGIKFYVGLRTVGATLPPVRFGVEEQSYFWRNRQWALLDPDGNPTSHLSLAFPEVRQYWISYLREMVQYEPDGVDILFSRSRPFVLYEEPVVESFREKYDIDPRALEETDPRWLRHRADYVTQFLREIRGALNEEGAKMGKRLELVCHVQSFGIEKVTDLLKLALDVGIWAKEDLVDILIPHPVFLNMKNASQIVRQFKKLLRGSRTKLYPTLYPNTCPADVYAGTAGALYDSGADGLAFWQIKDRRTSEWAMIKRLGHRDFFLGSRRKHWIEKGRNYYRRIPLKTLNGLAADPKYSYTDG